MEKLAKQNLSHRAAWEKIGIKSIQFDYEAMAAATEKNPLWVHFGAGNIFRGFIAMLQQTLLDKGLADRGIIAVETYDLEIIEKIYRPYDHLGLLAVMKPDGSLEKSLIASIADAYQGDSNVTADWRRLVEIFQSPSLALASFTITEKGYALKNMNGNYLPDVANDLKSGPDQPKHVMAKVAALAYCRYQKGAFPIAFVSMDNCSHNGEKLASAVYTIAEQWVKAGLAEPGFLDYLQDPAKVSFPWTMIDKITPRPAEAVQKALQESGFTATEIVCTQKHTFIAPFVNAEKPQYLVIEDHFPNGRPPLEKAGVMFTDRPTVEKVEKMKVGTCLNPLHTALAIFGCLFGYTLIADEMNDADLKKLVEKIGYEEGMPVVVDPGILKPLDFIREVIEVRLPNPYIPDTPQRIATDTSQKLGVRFGETLRSYEARPDLAASRLTYIPIVIAAWCRYLLGIDDSGKTMDLSPDPLLSDLQQALAGCQLGKPDEVGNLSDILSNQNLFGVDLYAVGLGKKVETYFRQMLAGPGAVRAVLQRCL